MMFWTLYVLLLISLVDSCYIWGTDSGECSTDTLDPLWRATNMPYCQDRVDYPACLPVYKTLPPMRQFPEGRWINNTVLTKDTWVGTNCEAHIKERIALESNRSLQRKGENEYGDKGRIKHRFKKNTDCQNAYRNLFCWVNFPRCDPNRDLTYPTCRSACENYFKSCRFGRGLWRCGKSKYFNGYGPESPSYVGGNVTYKRDYFPGQPFRENQYTKGGSEVGYCTPSITGAGHSTGYHSSFLLAFVMTLALVTLSWMFEHFNSKQ
eukprot:scaffold295_cov167-Ochromonas_danica.AAC.5